MHQKEKAVLAQYIKESPDRLALKGKQDDLDWHWISLQVKYRQKGRKKLPRWSENTALHFPTGLAYEQCSSEATAQYKAQLITGNTMADLTGGSGVDAYAFSSHFDSLYFCERQEDLALRAKENFEALSAPIQVHTGDGLQWLENFQGNLDLIYLDPHRRDDAEERVFHWDDYQPALQENLNFFLDKAPKILVKISPMADVQALKQSLPCIASIHLVYFQKEMKEILVEFQRDFPADKAPSLHLANLDLQKEWCISEPAQTLAPNQWAKAWKKFLVIPDALWMKSQQWEQICSLENLQKVNRHSHLFLTDKDQESLLGNRYRINRWGKLNALKKEIKGKNFELILRHFPTPHGQLRQQLKLKGSNTHFVVACTDFNEEPTVLIVEKLP